MSADGVVTTLDILDASSLGWTVSLVVNGVLVIGTLTQVQHSRGYGATPTPRTMVSLSGENGWRYTKSLPSGESITLHSAPGVTA